MYEKAIVCEPIEFDSAGSQEKMQINPRFLELLAVGDAYGMKYEFVYHEGTATKADLFYGPHPKFSEYVAGHYTDDTQMSLANLELLLERVQALDSTSEDDFICAWLKTFQRDPHRGYSAHMWNVMSESSNVREFKRCVSPEKGVTGGAAMRAAPFGLLGDINQVKHLTALQACITHDTPCGITSALAVALSVHFLHHGGSRQDLCAFLAHHLGKGWQGEDNGYTAVPNNGLKIVQSALVALLDAHTLSDALLSVVNNEVISDTDTVCALTMAFVSRCGDIQDDLPLSFFTEIEGNAFGLDYLRSIDQRALSFFPSKGLYSRSIFHNTQPRKKLPVRA